MRFKKLCTEYPGMTKMIKVRAELRQLHFKDLLFHQINQLYFKDKTMKLENLAAFEESSPKSELKVEQR